MQGESNSQNFLSQLAEQDGAGDQIGKEWAGMPRAGPDHEQPGAPRAIVEDGGSASRRSGSDCLPANSGKHNFPARVLYPSYLVT